MNFQLGQGKNQIDIDNDALKLAGVPNVISRSQEHMNMSHFPLQTSHWVLLFPENHLVCLSVHLSVGPSVHPSVDGIVSALCLQQYSLDPFHIIDLIKQLQKVCQVLSVMLSSKIWNFWQIF